MKRSISRFMSFVLCAVVLMTLFYSSAQAATIRVTGVKLNITSAELIGNKYQNNPLQLRATIIPSNATNKKVVWKSSNTKVAIVSSSGLVTAKGIGSATITATTSDGSKVASCIVKIPSTKKYSRTYTVNEEWPYYMKDTVTIYVNGLTGNIVDADVYQRERDLNFVGVIKPGGIKVVQKTNDFIRVRSLWTVKAGIWKFSYPIVTVKLEYVMLKNGAFTVLSKQVLK